MNKNILEIQLIRGFCVFFIIIGHITGNLITWSAPGPDTFFQYFDGTTTLDVFFALSGFVICRLLLTDLGKANNVHQSLQISSVFWLRRIWRLLPAAWLWLALILLMTAFFNSSGAFGSFKDAWAGALSAFLQIANFKFIDCWDEEYFCGPSFPYWTLSLEEQFYLFLPLFMIFSKRWFLPCISVLLFTQMFIPFLTFSPALRVQGLLLGILLAFWSLSPSYKIFEPTFLKNKWASRAMMVTMLTLMCVVSHRIIPSYAVHQISSVIGVIMIFITTWNAGYLFADKWVYGIGLWLGDRAYAMYLCHIPVMYMTREIAFRILGPEVSLGPQHFWYLVPAALVLIVLLSDLTFRLVERPLRSKGVVIAKGRSARFAEERATEAAKTPPAA